MNWHVEESGRDLFQSFISPYSWKWR